MQTVQRESNDGSTIQNERVATYTLVTVLSDGDVDFKLREQGNNISFEEAQTMALALKSNFLSPNCEFAAVLEQNNHTIRWEIDREGDTTGQYSVVILLDD